MLRVETVHASERHTWVNPRVISRLRLPHHGECADLGHHAIWAIREEERRKSSDLSTLRRAVGASLGGRASCDTAGASDADGPRDA
jgi:hypothetical protein